MKGYIPKQLTEVNPHRKEGRKPVAYSVAAERVERVIGAFISIPLVMIAVHIAASWMKGN